MSRSTDLPTVYQDVILRHNRDPSHRGELANASHQHEGFSRLCGETLTVWLRLDAQKRIADIRFSGEVSAVAMASASMMTRRLELKSRDQSVLMCQQVQAFLKDPDMTPANWIESDVSLSSLQALSGYRSRLAAAALPWQTCEKALQTEKSATST